MTKSLMQFGIALSALLLTVAPPAEAAGDSEELEQIRAKVSGIFDEIEPQYIMPAPIDGWFTGGSHTSDLTDAKALLDEVD